MPKKRNLEEDEPIRRNTKRSRRNVVLSDDEDDAEDQYEIERIRAIQFKEGNYYFLIKWKGYPDSENSWEPKENLNETALASISNIPIQLDYSEDESEDDYESEEESEEEEDSESGEESEDDDESARMQFLRQEMEEDFAAPFSNKQRLFSRCLQEENGFTKYGKQLSTEIGMNQLMENMSNSFDFPESPLLDIPTINGERCDVCNRIRTLKYSGHLSFTTKDGERVENRECFIGPVCALKMRFMYLFKRILEFLDENPKDKEDINEIFSILAETNAKIVRETQNYNPKKPFSTLLRSIDFPMDENIPFVY